jgi:hypothetical protein
VGISWNLSLIPLLMLAASCTPRQENRVSSEADARKNKSTNVAIKRPALEGATGRHALCSGRFSNLMKYVGDMPREFIEEPEVSSRMANLMGQTLPRLKANLDVSGTVDLIGCELVVQGNARHQGGEHNAILSFSVYSGKMTVGMLDGKELVVRTNPAGTEVYDHLPAHVRDWLFIAASGFRSRGEPPAQLKWVRPEEK